MSVVRIPKPDEDAFPWPRVAAAVVLGGALGLGIAWCGMETDRSAALEDDAAALTAPGGPRVEPVGEPNVDGPPQEAEVAADPATTEPAVDPSTAVDASILPDDPDAAPPADAAADERPQAEPGAMAPRGAVMLRRGRVAYLRCDGVPQRDGPFPCPRDEPLEAAVWSAISEVERCAQSPGAGQADLVVDLSTDAAPTIRTRDTFPPDVARTDEVVLLACTTESLGNVRSSLSPRRLVVSFRLTLDPSEP